MLHNEEAMHKTFYAIARLNMRIERHLFKIEHGVRLNTITASRLKSQGLKGGLPDYLFYKKNSNGQILWIEFKYAKNKQSESQKAFEFLATENNDKYLLSYDIDEAIAAVKQHMEE